MVSNWGPSEMGLTWSFLIIPPEHDAGKYSSQSVLRIVLIGEQVGQRTAKAIYGCGVTSHLFEVSELLRELLVVFGPVRPEEAEIWIEL